jgi:microcystin-dependent protein
MAIPTISWSEVTPAGTDAISAGDDRIRELKTQIREVIDVDHDFPSSGNATTTGQHKQMTLQESTDIGSGADGVPILGAQTINSIPELVYTTQDDDDIQLTEDDKVGGTTQDAIFADVTATSISVKSTLNSSCGFVPIGAVVAWMKNLTGTPSLPANFVECNGQLLSDTESVFDNVTIPNLNGLNYFLRGNATSGATGGEETHTLTTTEMPAHTHNITSYSSDSGTGPVANAGIYGSVSNIETGSAGSGGAHENRPPFMNCVWVMRIK